MTAVRAIKEPFMARALQFLVVDDFQTMRRILATLLREMGYTKVLEAENGKKALQCLHAELAGATPVDFVIADWNMPEMDGMELLQAIRQDVRLASLPVLMVTAEAKRENIISAAHAGADGYIVKPFNATTLQQKLQSILQRKGVTA